LLTPDHIQRNSGIPPTDFKIAITFFGLQPHNTLGHALRDAHHAPMTKWREKQATAGNGALELN
jgi:hypothetical protein